MEIHLLKATITEQDLNELVKRHLPKDQPVEDITIRVSAEGVHVQGVYPLFINVSFETLWTLAIHEGKVKVQLASMRAMGIPGNVFKSAVLKLVGDLGKKEDWLQMEGDSISLDVDRLLAKHGPAVRTNLKAITCQAGLLVLEAGS